MRETRAHGQNRVLNCRNCLWYGKNISGGEVRPVLFSVSVEFWTEYEVRQQGVWEEAAYEGAVREEETNQENDFSPVNKLTVAAAT